MKRLTVIQLALYYIHSPELRPRTVTRVASIITCNVVSIVIVLYAVGVASRLVDALKALAIFFFNGSVTCRFGLSVLAVASTRTVFGFDLRGAVVAEISLDFGA